jgi:polysaccharide chain length determinant protein (PEP-CTERM system associated)
MLPGKKYKPEDLLRVLKRRFWLLIVPFAVVSAGTAVVVRKLPDRYMSQATILVAPQRVPEQYVKSPVGTRVQDRLRNMQQTILSRTRLEKVIEEFNLYPNERRNGIMEDVVQNMRYNDVQVRMLEGDVFTISFWGDNPRTVQKVAERLMGLFVEENVRDRSNQAETTNQFLESTVEEARRRLTDTEKKLQQYRESHAGELPSQSEANLQSMAQTMTQVQQINVSLNQDREQRLFFDKQLKELESDAPPNDPGTATYTAATPDAPARITGGTVAMQYEVAKQQLAFLQTTKGEGHPDVKSFRRIVGELQQKAEAEALARPVTLSEAALSPAEQAKRKRIQDLRNSIDALDRSTAAKQAEDKRLRTVAAALQKRIEVAPMRESEMAELMRDYGTLSNIYIGLLTKKEDSTVAANLERRQGGEQFKPLDLPRIPERPADPDRPRLNLLGMVAGFAIGLALIALFEYRDATFRTDDEVTHHLAFPVLAVVPLMESDQERRRTTRRRWLLGLSLGSTVAGCLAVLVYTFVF